MVTGTAPRSEVAGVNREVMGSLPTCEVTFLPCRCVVKMMLGWFIHSYICSFIHFMYNSTIDYMLVHKMICSLWGYLPRSIYVLCIQRIAYYICASYIFINGLGGMGGGGVNYDMRRVVRVSENSGHWSVRWRGLYGCKTACICVGVVSWWFRRWGLNSWSEIETRMAQLFSCHRSCSFIYIGIILSCFTH